ncbi:MAG TPA: xanthine dehydrogenase family protein subunit M [Dehalococcoidia bacterium]|nr:xanthine dehydrogenase family protein subunit M [Dehalococcoidia bacterium]
MQYFDYAAPQSLGEALSLMASAGENGRVLAGGTDLIVMMRAGRRRPTFVLDGKQVPELQELSLNGGLTLGAAVSCRRIWENSDVSRAFPALIDSASIIGGVQIQGRASVGGNLCNAAPSADCIPTLIALGATCSIASSSGNREVAAEDFCVAPGQTVLRPGEILVNMKIPAQSPNSGAAYLRFTPRNEMDIAIAGVGASVVLEADRETIKSARIALSAVGPTPIFASDAGQLLAGKSASDESALMAAAEAAREASRPITDMRGTIDQRKHLVGVLTVRALKKAIERAKGSNNG